MRTAILLLLLVAAPARADDVAATMAGMPNEAAECRYAAMLCEKYLSAMDAQNGQAALRAWNDDQTAEKLIGVGREKKPACFKPCPEHR